MIVSFSMMSAPQLEHLPKLILQTSQKGFSATTNSASQ
jgi:hypothetical protein